MPKICCIDLKQEDLELLQNKYDDIYIGTLGKIQILKYKNQYDKIPLLPDYVIPNNLHEYDIIIIDLNNHTTVDYDETSKDKINRTGKNRPVLVCNSGQNIFDPRPFASYALNERIMETKRDMIIVIFSSSDDDDEYSIANDVNDLYNKSKVTYYLFELLPDIVAITHSGKEVIVCEEIKDSRINGILCKYIPDFEYKSAFRLPSEYDSELNTRVTSKEYLPLLKSTDDKTVSYAAEYNNKMYYIFPDSTRKGELIIDLLDNYFPAISPELFPESTLNAWLGNEAYFVPNHKDLVNHKIKLVQEYETKIQNADYEISNNLQLHSWLHDLITKDGDELKSAVIKYLEYIQFDEVTDMDVQGINDEDIQIEYGKKLIITEVKGLGGTSTDSDMLQVTKHFGIRTREHKDKDVSSLYIVNHRKHMEPLNRPFDPLHERQIKMLEGLPIGYVTTWQLFLTYKYIKEDVFSKSDIREQITNHSFITFKPLENYQEFGVSKVYKDRTVASIDIVDFEVSIGQDIVIFNDHFIMDKARIISIQKGNNQVETISNGKIGIVCGLPFTEGKSIFLRKA
ncbi:MAG: hypothetical protein LHW56_04380 [Candidatus Cloacimonetes bacterium]|nr:hypothetical protein [Candidatus Cloacimonadota bacterium]MDY0172126.1 hypothetical protein [Candidatus Cloacimonadaceae bacterium]